MIFVRKKWDERTKLQLGKLIRNQLDMQIKLNDAVTRAAEILQAPRSTCMNYWQKELKNLDYSDETLSLKPSKANALLRTDSSRLQLHQESKSEDQLRSLQAVFEKLRENEESTRMLHRQIGELLKEHAALTKQLGEMVDAHKLSATEEVEPPRVMQPLTIQQLAAGDIVRVHYHIWQDFYYISSIDMETVYGYKLNKNMQIRRKSKQKPISMEILQYGKIVHRQVKLEDVKARDD